MARRPRQEKAYDARQAQEPSQKSTALTEKLLNAILSISRCATLEEALLPLLDAALDLTKMDGGGVYWVQDNVAVLRHHRGLPRAFIREVRRMPLTPAPIQVLLGLREPVEVAEISPKMRELLHRHGVQHAFSFPLRARKTVFGFLNVGSTRAEAPDRADIQALHVLVGQMEALFCRLYSEKALRESEERFRTFMDNSPAIAWMKDEQGRHVYLNKAFERSFSVRREEWLGKTDFEIWPPETAREFRANDLVVLREDRPLEVIEKTPGADGEWRYWWNVKFPFRDALGAKYVAGIGLDVTDHRRAQEALQQSEQRYRTLAETARDFIFVLDKEERVQYVNQYGAAALGCRPEEMIGCQSSELFPPETAARHRQSLRRVIESGESLCVVARSRFQDRERWMTTQLTPIRGPAGEIQGVLGIARDITQQKQLEEELRQLNEQLELQVTQRTRELTQRAGQLQRLTLELSQAEERERQRLAEFLHDDLQQVLAGAKFHLGLLGSRVRGDEELLETIEQIRQMLKEAIEKSRSLSHELGPPALYHGTLADVFEWLAHQMDRKHGLVVHLDMHGHVDSSWEPVRSLLYRASQEILFNIVKHAGVREAKVRLQRVRDELWLTILDRGRGFDPASLARTTGFGLLSIRERVELLGGHLRIKSAPGRGSIFLITLPDVGVPSEVDIISAPADK